MVQRPRLLVSVRSLAEAREALVGGCDILDIKEPANGALGMADPRAIAEIAADVRRVDRSIPLSAALGELTDWLDRDSAPALPPTLTFAKLGLAGMQPRGDWTKLWARIRERFEAAAPSTTSWVAVAYADWRLAAAPPPLDVLTHAAATGCRVLLLDTFTKHGRSLLDFLSDAELRTIASAARQSGLPLALAGGLRRELLPRLVEYAPEIVAIRSAACRDGKRKASVCAASVRQFRETMERAWCSATDEPVAPEPRSRSFKTVDLANPLGVPAPLEGG